ncbi:MAG TPA: aminotransferase class IV [Gemmatimonadales bacterium]|jgi:4-amino-4-deoxychorismate lyase|nr:aminotransferase class IV [Gemmatimonadales bacterium]
MSVLIETMRVRRGRIPLFHHHAVRFAASLAALGLPVGLSLEDAAREADSVQDGVVRVEADDGGLHVSSRLHESPRPISVRAIPGFRPYPHKTGDREQFARACKEAQASGADDALLVSTEGEPAEGTTWSLFWWDSGGLKTPALSLGVLPGVARARFAEMGALGEGKVAVDGLAARGCFAANAVRGVIPIREINGALVRADERTVRLAARFWP